MKQIRYLISVILILSLLLGAMPVSALAETLQELAIEEAMQDGVPANAEGDLPDETTGDEAPMQEIFLIEEETAEPQLSLNDLPQMMEDIQAALSETVPEEEDILEKTIETETESAPMEMSLAPLLIEEAQPISMDPVEYIIGEESADLALDLPAEALPVAEIEGLICDADYFHAEGTLTLASAWLQAQDAEEITMTIHGADGNTYLQPIQLVNLGETEIQPLFTGEYDVSNLFVNGEPVSNGSGDGWSYVDGTLKIDITSTNITLSGSGVVERVEVQDGTNDDLETSSVLTFDSVNLQYLASYAGIMVNNTNGDNGAAVWFKFVGVNTITNVSIIDRMMYAPSINLHFTGDGTLNISEIRGKLLVLDGITLNSEYLSGGVTINSGTLNIIDGRGYGIDGTVEQYGGELNIRKSGDGLTFKAIRGLYLHGGKINIDLSGASKSTGIEKSAYVYGGELNIRITGATQATAIGHEDYHFVLRDGKVNVELMDIQGEAVGVRYGDGITLKGGNLDVAIAGASSAKGIWGTHSESWGRFTLEGADLNLDIANVSGDAVGIETCVFDQRSGSLWLKMDPHHASSTAIHSTYGDADHEYLYFSGGYADILANRLTPGDCWATAQNKNYSLLNGSRLLYDSSNLKIEYVKQIFIDYIGHESYPASANISGEGWEFDYATNTLYLNDFSGDSIGFYEEADSITLHLTGENSVKGIQLPEVKQTHISGSGSMNISDCRYGIETGSLQIGAEASLNVKVITEAFKLSGNCTLNGQEIETNGCNEISIASGSVIRNEAAEGLRINGVDYTAADLTDDLSGSGWQWIATDQTLKLNDSNVKNIVSTLMSVRVYATESCDGLTITARNLILSGDEGIWVTDVEISAENLEILSGSYAQMKDVPLALDNLTITGGKLIADAGVVATDVIVSGGILEADTLTVEDLLITGGSLNVTGSILYYEDENGKTYYGLVAVNGSISGGNLLTAEPAFFGTYTQTGGTVEFAANAASYAAKHLLAVGASSTFTAIGGTLYARNGYEAALFATEITLGGTLTADIYGEPCALLAEKTTVAGKKIKCTEYTTVVLSKGKVEKLEMEKYYGLMIKGQGFTKHMVETMSFSGTDWSWNHETKTLSIKDIRGSDDDDIYFDCGAVTLHLLGGSTGSNYYLEIYSAGALTITGDGELDQASVSSPKAIKLVNCRNIARSTFTSNSTITLDHVSGNLWRVSAMKGITINNSTLSLSDCLETNKNLTIKNTYIQSWANDIYYYCSYANGKTSISNSIITMDGSFYSKNGTTIAKDAAVFKRNWENNSYILQKNATLSQDWYFKGGKHIVPSGKTLTIKSGKTLYTYSTTSVIADGGKIIGNIENLDRAESIWIEGPDTLGIGCSLQLSTGRTPDKAFSDIRWISSNVALCEVDANGLVTATKNASYAGEKVTITVMDGINNPISATHEITLIPTAQEIAAREASGRYAKNIVLSLDPANKTAHLTAKVYPYDAPQTVTWKSSDSKIVSVDENGVITAKKAGSANVYAVAADGSGVQSQNVKVTVKKAPTSIKFTTTKPVLGYDPENGTGSTYQLKVKLSSGSASTVKYTSANEGIAVVDANGIVTAKGTGKVKITAQTYNGKKASCTVQVKSAPQSISISPKQLTIGVGMKHSFTASIPKNSFGSWYFSTSNACGGIDAATGEFVALKPGEMDVIVTTFNGRSDSCTVQVLPAPEELKLNQPQLQMGLNEKFTLQVEASLKDDSPAMGSYSYSSSDKKVATVSAAGKITAKKRGTAIITVTANGGASAQCEVIVEKAPSKVSLKVKKVTLVYDEAMHTGTDFLNPASLPSGTSSALTYKSSNQKVAVVDGEGRITAKGVGTAKITVKTFNGKSATCTVTVKAAPKELKFDQEIYTISVGQKLYAKITNASGLDLTQYGEVVSLKPEAAILAMDAQGASIAGREVGIAQLKATAFNGAEGSAEVRILPPPDVLTLEKTTLTLKKGKKYTVKAQLSREDGQETTAGIALTSGNTKIAGVSGMTITAKAKGKTVITVQTHNGLIQEIQLRVN